MNQRKPSAIKEYLQNTEVIERIQKRMIEARSEATVTIGRAEKLFGFTQNQLRDWEDRREWLKPERPEKKDASENDGKETRRHRQYSLSELYKLAMLRALMDDHYTLNDIAQNIDFIWDVVSNLEDQIDYAAHANGKSGESQEGAKLLTVNDIQHVQKAKSRDLDAYAYEMYKNQFFRYYTSRALRLSVELISEGIFPILPVALVLPKYKNVPVNIQSASQLKELGESLIGWTGTTRSFYTYVTDAPTFQHSSEYDVAPLKLLDEEKPADRTWLIVDRETAKHLLEKDAKGVQSLQNLTPKGITPKIVTTIRRLLEPIYAKAPDWDRFFGSGMREAVDMFMDFDSSVAASDLFLTELAKMVVQLGGKLANGKDRWRFCCILLPRDRSLPLQKSSLVVQGQSKDSPHKVRVSSVAPDKYVNSITLRAYQSGHVINRNKIYENDPTVSHHALEGDIRSALAIPVGAEDGLPALAVLYVVSDELNAFSSGDEAVLRMVGRMIQELLLIYQARQSASKKLIPMIAWPEEEDILLPKLFSENEFAADVEKLLEEIQQRDEQELERQDLQGLPKEVSFIGIDINLHSRNARRYGEVAARNLVREVASKIHGEMSLAGKTALYQFYHIQADRFYLMLDKVSLEDTRKIACKLKQALTGTYKVDARYIATDQTTSSDELISIDNIVVRVCVASFEYKKLKELFGRPGFKNTPDPVAGVRADIQRQLNDGLDPNRYTDLTKIMSWHRKPVWTYRLWSSDEKEES